MKEIAILLGTSRYEGNTKSLISSLKDYLDFKVYELKDYNISFFDYEHNNSEDDFIPLINKLLNYDHIVFATPIYWYTMSAQMKVFFDRFSDLLAIEKDLGRKLRGKECSILSTGQKVELPSCFEEVFKLSFEYLGMNYKGMLYSACGESFEFKDNKKKILEYVGEVHA